MITIEEYVEDVFIDLPKTKEIDLLKEKVLMDMRKGYDILIDQGKPANEAVAILISEYSDINQFVNEYHNNKLLKIDTLEKDIRGFIKAKKKSSLLIAIGVVCCIFAISVYIFLGQFLGDKLRSTKDIKDFIGLVPLTIFIVLGLVLFVNSADIMKSYKKLESFNLDDCLISKLTKEYEGTYKISKIILKISIVASVLSPLIYLLLSNLFNNIGNYPISIFLIYIAICVYGIIFSSGVAEMYEIISGKVTNIQSRQLDNYAASSIFSIATIVYLLWSFLFNAWNISWCVYVVALFVYLILSIIKSCCKK